LREPGIARAETGGGAPAPGSGGGGVSETFDYEPPVVPDALPADREHDPRSTFRARLAAAAADRTRGWFVRRLLAAADVVAVLVAFGVTQTIFAGNPIGGGSRAILIVVTLPFWIVAVKLYGLYDLDEERPVHSTVDELGPILNLVTVGVWSFGAFCWLTHVAFPNPTRLSVFWFLLVVSLTSCRAGARALARRHVSFRQNTLIVGAGDIGQLLGRKLAQHPEYGLELVGYVDAEPKAPLYGVSRLPLLGRPEDIAEIVERHGVERVIVAYSRDENDSLLELIRTLRTLTVQIDVVPRLFDAVTPRVSMHMVEGFPVLGLTPARIARSSRLLKRIVDIVGAGLLLLLTLPLMLLTALLVRLDSNGSVFFRQVRLGAEMREFKVLKFRTMRTGTAAAPHRDYIRDIMDRNAAPSQGSLYKLARNDDVTRVGRWLRRTSLDELPQLLNVLRGDMSLVGPRPCIPYETEHFAPHHFDRFLVPAGLTGLWQVEARSHSTFAEALDLDVAYARGWSFGLDLRLLMRTPLLMFNRRGVD
jgi:exopolysaccharide biosynthesis polyprenyl glycosylphosphotransferase